MMFCGDPGFGEDVRDALFEKYGPLIDTEIPPGASYWYPPGSGRREEQWREALRRRVSGG
jgi:hypothetical protein